MKKNLFTIALSAIMVVAIAVPAFATENIYSVDNVGDIVIIENEEHYVYQVNVITNSYVLVLMCYGVIYTFQNHFSVSEFEKFPNQIQRWRTATYRGKNI